MDEIIEELYNHLENCRLKGKVISISHLPEIGEEYNVRNSLYEFDADFYRERLTFFTFTPPEDLPHARSVIIVAVPRPQTRLLFSWQGGKKEFVLPPTYCGHRQVIFQTQELLTKLLAPQGYRVVQARLPQKLLTVRSGLAKYGRNNITYIQGMGSFYQPTVFFSDLPAEVEPWYEPVLMERCQTCNACRVKCPTGAIGEDRFLLHAERCLVFHNERAAELPFPAWIDPAVHNSIMGCMICQRFCPEDKPFLDWFEGNEEFNEDETRLLLEGASRERLPFETVEKLERLELMEDLDKIPRNLSILLGH